MALPAGSMFHQHEVSKPSDFHLNVLSLVKQHVHSANVYLALPCDNLLLQKPKILNRFMQSPFSS